MAKETYFLVETYDPNLDLRERHYITFDKFKELLLARWPELKKLLEDSDHLNNNEGD